MSRHLTASVVLAATPGLTRRQLGLWSTYGFFGDDNRGGGSGRWRSYSEQDIVVARALAALARAGVNQPTRLAHVAAQVRSGADVAVLDLAPGVTLLVDTAPPEGVTP